MFDLAIIHSQREINYVENVIDNLEDEFPGIRPHVFCELNVRHFPLRVTHHRNQAQYGPFFNWLRAIHYFRKSQKKWLLICEDDIQWGSGTGKLFQDYLIKQQDNETIGFVSGYCSRVNANPKNLGFSVAKVSAYGWCGMLAIALPIRNIDLILNHQIVQQEKEGRHLDYLIGSILLALNKKLIVHTPTLVYHCGGLCSTLVPANHKNLHTKVRQAYVC